jgi:CrcB protein
MRLAPVPMSSLADRQSTRAASTALLGAIFAGGMAGALARALLARALPAGHGDWPWATFAVNVGGSLLLGYFTTRLQERLPPSTFRRPFLGTGLCGALTTFSTFQIELLRMARDGDRLLLAGYAAASVAACFAAVYLATALTRRVRLR